MANELVPGDPGQFLFYQTEDGLTRVQVRVGRDTVWLSLNQMADLFQRDKSVISRHISNLFEDGELRRESVVAEFATTAADGKRYRVEHFNLDVIISVGYRVKSLRGTQFRIWATQKLRESAIDHLIVCDTIPVPPEKRLPNMKVLSIAPLLGEAIRRNHEGESISELFV